MVATAEAKSEEALGEPPIVKKDGRFETRLLAHSSQTATTLYERSAVDPKIRPDIMAIRVRSNGIETYEVHNLYSGEASFCILPECLPQALSPNYLVKLAGLITGERSFINRVMEEAKVASRKEGLKMHTYPRIAIREHPAYP